MTSFSFTVDVKQESIVKQYLSLNYIIETKKSRKHFSGWFPSPKKYNYPVITFFVQVENKYQLYLLKAFLNNLKEASTPIDTTESSWLDYLYNPIWIIILIIIDIMFLINAIRYDDVDALLFIIPSIVYFIIYYFKKHGVIIRRDTWEEKSK
ncbi:MAG: hypothetical protein WC346_16300 [Methanogenium sp.]|jgi:hypothetical protein